MQLIEKDLLKDNILERFQQIIVWAVNDYRNSIISFFKERQWNLALINQDKELFEQQMPALLDGKVMSFYSQVHEFKQENNQVISQPALASAASSVNKSQGSGQKK